MSKYNGFNGTEKQTFNNKTGRFSTERNSLCGNLYQLFGSTDWSATGNQPGSILKH